jgi:hypothetical protein
MRGASRYLRITYDGSSRPTVFSYWGGGGIREERGPYRYQVDQISEVTGTDSARWDALCVGGGGFEVKMEASEKGEAKRERKTSRTKRTGRALEYSGHFSHP